MREIAKTIGISNEWVHQILHEHLHIQTARKMGAVFAHN